MAGEQVYEGRFVVDVALSGDWSGRSVAGLVKPMIDGMVSALHCHVGPADDDVLRRLTPYADVTRVRDELTGPRLCPAWTSHPDPANEVGCGLESCRRPNRRSPHCRDVDGLSRASGRHHSSMRRVAPHHTHNADYAR